jgi:membrane-bound inhibitor of C-type lysozyme
VLGGRGQRAGGAASALATSRADGTRARHASRRALRIAELQIKSGQGRAPAPVLYACDNTAMVTAYFYHDTPIPAAVLNLEGAVQDFAIVHPAGSGAQYGGATLTFWTKGDTALVIRQGKPDVSCRAKQQ